MTGLPPVWNDLLGPSPQRTPVRRHVPTGRAALVPNIDIPDEQSPTRTSRQRGQSFSHLAAAFDASRGRPVAPAAVRASSSTGRRALACATPPASSVRLTSSRSRPAPRPTQPDNAESASDLVDRLIEEALVEGPSRGGLHGDLVNARGIPLHNTAALSPSQVRPSIAALELDPALSPSGVAAALSSHRGLGAYTTGSNLRPTPAPEPPPPTTALPPPLPHPCIRELSPSSRPPRQTRDSLSVNQSKTLTTRAKICFCIHSTQFRTIANRWDQRLFRFDQRRGELQGRAVSAAARALAIHVFAVKKGTLNNWLSDARSVATWLPSVERLTLGQALEAVPARHQDLFSHLTGDDLNERVSCPPRTLLG
eukprot:GHVU01010224.1.p1 GENE.GHVU01010224.1~~GHVU01010224.1.p1  ORF type:complete len:367 (+),score=13.12 GHVU01010224.1:1794-2894(+)